MEEGDYVMKTTIDLPDALLHSAKEVAKQSQTTLRALIEEGLRRVLSDYKAPAKTAFKLKNASVGGDVMLLPDSRAWEHLEEDHVIGRLANPKPKQNLDRPLIAADTNTLVYAYCSEPQTRNA